MRVSLQSARNHLQIILSFVFKIWISGSLNLLTWISVPQNVKHCFNKWRLKYVFIYFTVYSEYWSIRSSCNIKWFALIFLIFSDASPSPTIHIKCTIIYRTNVTKVIKSVSKQAAIKLEKNCLQSKQASWQSLLRGQKHYIFC